MTRLESNTRSDLRWFVDRARPPRVRSMREFAEAEVVIPDGPYAGRRFRASRQPYSGLWLDAVDQGRWSRLVATGPTQSGKTLSCFVIPLLYHLFEVGETVICGLPDMDMAGDKWREDILPAIEQSRFRRLLPKRGKGSRGGRVESIQFGNGATLKFMSGGGGDKSRAGFTSRVVVITETDGMDQPGASSRESDKITQLEARTRAYGSRKRIYMECTVSTEQGRTWREYQEGTQSRILLTCPHCHGLVLLERDDLVGWHEADSQAEARSEGRFRCSECRQDWSEADRTKANDQAILLHEGQSIDEENHIQGDPVPTDTLGFRWSAVHNLFVTAGDLAADEWRARRSTDEENAEREMRQFVWCIPVRPSKWDETILDAAQLARRTAKWAPGLVAPYCEIISGAIDLGKYLSHWIIVAWSEGATGHVVDYGRLEVASDDLGVEQATMVALREFRDIAQKGWPPAVADDPCTADKKADHRTPDKVWIDAGYMTDVVYEFCRETGGKCFWPAVGRGASQQRHQYYNRPTRTGSVVKHIGEGFHISALSSQKLHLVEVDADYWKTWVHQRLATPMGQPGAMSLYRAAPSEHLAQTKHLTAERKTEQFVTGRGVVTKWEQLRRQNHWFDALYNACAAGYFAGVRLLGQMQKPQPVRRRLVVMPLEGLRQPDGRPWIDRERLRRCW